MSSEQPVAEDGAGGADTAPSADEETSELVLAGGCVVYRHGPDGVEVLVVHRPRYDDWDFPKGKCEPGESELDCAIRETEEESGCVGEIVRELALDRYRVRGRDKQVRWWLMRYTGGLFSPNAEVDEIRWLPLEEAKRILSYGHARALVSSLPEDPSLRHESVTPGGDADQPPAT